MFDFIKNLAWYPPAETKIPWPAILSAFTKQTADFKTELCNYLDVNYCILGQSARALLFKLLDNHKKQDGSQGDEVLIPGYTCYSVAAAIAKAGLKITIYDLDPKTLHADLDSIGNAISEKTLAVVTQHLFGMLTPIDELKKITHKNGAYLIEDGAQAFGKVDGLTPPGTKGDFGLFSFGRGKPLPIGGGGALVSRDQSDTFNEIVLDRQEKGFEQAVVTAVTQIISKPAFYWIPESLPLGLGETVFNPEFKAEGMPNAIESMMVVAMSNLDRLNQNRQRIADIYSETIDSNFQIKNNDKAISIIRYPVMLSIKSMAQELKRLGVRRMYPNAIPEEKTINPYLKNNQKPTPGAVEIEEKLITLPTHMGIDEKLAEDISILVQEQVRQD